MPLHVFNDLTRTLEEFVPQNSRRITMYTCGVTTYAPAHIGHARFAVVWDTVRRYLELAFPEVELVFVQNFTDIDDKIILKASEAGEDALTFAYRYVEAYRQDIARLGVRPPTHAPQATAYIPQMLAMIQGLVDKGLAYPSDGDVYFAVERFPGYGKLSGRTLDQMKAGARIEVSEKKRHPMDFALWKAAKPGEPAWDSPWGLGRPGWHIECSAMARTLLGDTLDIHAGGTDLTFPHHENEIAQSEGFTGHEPFARYWLHNGMVNMGGEKMSKSLGNVANVRQLLEVAEPDAVRFFLLNTHYRQELEFSDEALAAAGNGLRRLRRELAARRSQEVPLSGEETGWTVTEAVAEANRSFRAGMDADFNTSRAIAALFKAAERLRYADGTRAQRERAVETLVGLGAVLGLDLAKSEESVLVADRPLYDAVAAQLQGLRVRGWFEGEVPAWEAFEGAPEAWVDRLVALRAEAKTRHRDFQTADAIREALKPFVAIQDHPDRTSSWKPVTPVAIS